MKCPACFNDLSQLQVGNLTVDVCQGACGGIWFDAFELQRVDEEKEEAGERLVDIQRDERIRVDPARKRDCPRCEGIKLRRHFFSARRRVEVDECPNCAGYWLDAGELALVRAERTSASTAGPSGQSNVSADVIRYLYRLQTEGRRGRET
jgi:Zn-finger nucleic acid-binding protein